MVTTYTYSYNPNTQTATLDADAQGHRQWKKTTLDGFGRSIKVETGYDSITVLVSETQYAACACSPLGKMWRISAPHAPNAQAHWTTYVYDARGRTIEVWATDGSITHYAYAGNTTTVTDPAGKWKKFTYDAQGNLVIVTEPDPANGSNTLTTNYTYNAANQLTNVSMIRGSVTQTRTFQWTGSDMTQATNPENGTVTYTYDGAHHVTQRTDAKNQRTTYSYDAFGRLQHVRHYDANNQLQAGQNVDYTYDVPSRNAWGRLAEVTFGSGTYVYGYNSAGRVTLQRHVISDVASIEADYQWDNRGRMTRMAIDAADTLNYQYDAMSRLVGMTDYNAATVATAQYDADYGQLSQLNWSGFQENRTYNELGQLTRIAVPGALDVQYMYTAGANNGRVTRILDGLDTQDFAYDALNRLVSVTSSIGNNEAMSYDGFGNLTSMNGASWTYNGTTNRRTDLTYDANGNVTVAGQTSHSWDIENRLSDNWSTYDPWGKRVSVIVNGQTQVYFYSITGQRVATYVEGEDGSLGPYYDSHSGHFAVNRYFGGKLIQSNGVAVVTDRLGSVRANAIGDHMSYTAYGAEKGTATANGRDKFGTYYRDGTGLDYADQRYYGQQGMFLSPDPYQASGGPSDPGSWNRYAYVQGDPINYYDPNGTFMWVPQNPVGPAMGYNDPGAIGTRSAFGTDGRDMAMIDESGSGEADNTSGPEPTCEGVLTQNLQNFLQTNDPAALKWDPNLAADLVAEGALVNIDPRLFASILTLESGHGASFSGNNPFGLGPGNTYPSQSAGIHSEGATLKRYVYTWGETTVSELYSGDNWVTTGKWHEVTVTYPGYCSKNKGGEAEAAKCKAAGVTVAGFLTSQEGNKAVGLAAGNASKLAYPCPK